LRLPRALRWSIVALAAASALGVGIGFLATDGSASQVPHANTPSRACFLSTSSFLSAGKLGEFVTFRDAPLFVFPGHGHTPRGTPPAFVTDFVEGRQIGALSVISLRSPYYEEERAAAQRLGYKMGRWPLTPLSGPVVADSPGPLEIYQTHYVFRTAAGAAALIKSLTESIGGLGAAGTVVTSPKVSSATAAYEFAGWYSPNDKSVEHVVGSGASFGNDLAQVLIAGGRNVTPSGVASVIGRVLSAPLRCMGGENR
jgi:hypothetical protein